MTILNIQMKPIAEALEPEIDIDKDYAFDTSIYLYKDNWGDYWTGTFYQIDDEKITIRQIGRDAYTYDFDDIELFGLLKDNDK